MDSSEAIIYLSANRGSKETDAYRSLITLKEGPFYNLSVVNDETLAGGASVQHKVEKEFSMAAVVIPLVGDIVTTERISPGQIHFLRDDFTITNPYKDQLVNYLYLEIKMSVKTDTLISDFDIDSNKNVMVPLSPDVYIYIGKFDGRRDGVLDLQKNSSGCFAFVIEGAFEVQNRLLHPRDGLALSNIRQIDFEALSNDAILLIIEVREAS